MINVKLDSGILNSILQIEKSKNSLDLVKIPINLSNKFRKNTKKRSSYASNKIEGNPLTYEQADAAIEAKNRHFLKPEQEIRNYYLALELLEKKLENKEILTLRVDKRCRYNLGLKYILEGQLHLVLGGSRKLQSTTKY